MNGIGTWQIAPVSSEPARRSEREQQSEPSAGHADQQAFGHLLANQSKPAAAQCSADGNLFAARSRRAPPAGWRD